MGALAVTDPIPFEPDWVVHPGATLDDWMKTQGTPWMDAKKRGIAPVVLYRLLVGEEAIDDPMAERLFRYTGISAAFWVNSEQIFRDGLAAGKAWTP